MSVRGLFVHPIKSCAPISIGVAEVGLRGFRDDRRWMVVDGDGRFLTQREVPALGEVRVGIDGERLVLDDDLAVPRRLVEGVRVPVTVWSHAGHALEHVPAAAWCSRRLGRTARLVYMPDDEVRPVNPARGRPGDQVSFADAYPVLLTAETSRLDLERRAGTTLAMARFRPNVVVSSGAPCEEDTWARLRLGAVSFRNVKPCDRCVVTTIDPVDRTHGKEPLRTLATFRERDGSVYFGVNLIPDQEGVVRVGDAVVVDATQPPFVA